jgi:hypothetical protein
MIVRRVLGPVAAILICLLPGAAAAYIGPGAGLSAIGTLVAVVGAVFLAIVGFIWYPIKRLFGGRRAPAAQGDPDGEE